LIKFTYEVIWSSTFICWNIFSYSFNSLLVIGQLIFSISSWFSLWRLYLSNNFSKLSILLALLLVMISYDPLYFCGFSCNFSFIISNFIDLIHLTFSWSVWLKVYQFSFTFKEKNFNFIDFWFYLFIYLF